MRILTEANRRPLRDLKSRLPRVLKPGVITPAAVASNISSPTRYLPTTWARSKKKHHGKARLSATQEVEGGYKEAYYIAVAQLDKEVIRQRYLKYNFLYTEVVMSMEPIPEPLSMLQSFLKKCSKILRFGTTPTDHEHGNGQHVKSTTLTTELGIPFQRMLTILARYTLADDENCFSIKERLYHRQRMTRLHSLVFENSVKSRIRTIVPRFRFKKYMQEKERIRSNGGSGVSNNSALTIAGDAMWNPSASTSSQDVITTAEDPLENPLENPLKTLRSTWRGKGILWIRTRGCLSLWFLSIAIAFHLG